MNSDENSSAAKTKNTGGVLLNRAASGAPVVRKGAGVPVFPPARHPQLTAAHERGENPCFDM